MPLWQSSSPASACPACSELKRLLCVLLALLFLSAAFLPEEAGAQEGAPVATSRPVTVTEQKIAAVLQILGIRGKDGEVLDQEDVRRIADSLIPVLEMAKSLPDETILPMLRTAAERCGIVLKDDQLSSLLGLFRSGSEDGGGEFSLPETIQDVQGAVSKISETASGAVRFFRTIRRTFHAMMDYFSRLGDLFH